MKKKNQIKIMKIILIKTINIIIPMIIMDTKKIIHMVQGNIEKRKKKKTSINVGMNMMMEMKKS